MPGCDYYFVDQHLCQVKRSYSSTVLIKEVNSGDEQRAGSQAFRHHRQKFIFNYIIIIWRLMLTTL